MKKLRWGVIGAGGIADRRTLPGMMIAKNAELIAVMELRAEDAERLRAKYGAKRAYTNDEELIRDPEIDAVYIASPVFLHPRQSIMAAQNGKHILLEKPFALTSGEAQQVVDECSACGVKLAAGFMMRFGTYVQAIKREIEAGRIGQLVSCDSLFTCWYPDIPGAWRQEKKYSGGGALMDMGIHCIDLIRYITGSRVTQVASMVATQTFSYEVDDASTLLLRLENGAICTVQSNFNIPDEAAKWRLNFFGTKGRLLGDSVIGQVDGGSVDALYTTGDMGYDAQQNGQKQNQKAIQLAAEFGNLYTREIENFGEAVLNGVPLVAPGQCAVDAQQIVEAAYRADAEKRTIDLLT
jgi:predicted dehydrogenase